MEPQISYKCVDCILNLFYGHYPYGANYFSLTYKLNFEAEAWEAMFDFLMEEKMIEAWGPDNKQVITEKGILLIKEHCGIQKYIERAAKKKLRAKKKVLHAQSDKKKSKFLPSKIINPPPDIMNNNSAIFHQYSVMLKEKKWNVWEELI